MSFKSPSILFRRNYFYVTLYLGCDVSIFSYGEVVRTIFFECAALGNIVSSCDRDFFGELISAQIVSIGNMKTTIDLAELK